MIQLINRDNPHIRIIADEVDKIVNDEYGILMNGITFGFTKGNWELKEYKEHQELKWSEEDEKMRVTILQDLANIKDAYPKVNIQPQFDWLESLKDRFNGQPQLTEFEKELVEFAEGYSRVQNLDTKDWYVKESAKHIKDWAKKELEK